VVAAMSYVENGVPANMDEVKERLGVDIGNKHINT
jgi:hypothetical protein